MGITLQFMLLVLCLCGSAFFSSSEVALLTLSPLQLRRLEQTHATTSAQLKRLLTPPTRLLSTILIGNTLLNVLISVLGFAIADQLLDTNSEWVAIVVMTLLLLLVGEIMPKRIALLWPEKLAIWYAGPLVFIMQVLRPFRAGLERCTATFSTAFHPRGRTLSDDEMETVVDMSAEEGVLHAEESAMLKAVLHLEELEARDVMTPRVDLAGYDLNRPGDSLADVARKAPYRQLVLYRDHIDQIEGVLDVRAFLLDPSHRLQAAWRPPLYVPESARLDRLLSQFETAGRRSAVVVDEYGGTAGILTRGDILEEITGDLDDEYGDHKLQFEPAGRDRWFLDGQVSLEDIRQKTGIALDAEGVERVSGWIAARLERMPHVGDAVQTDACRMVVQRMRRHRVLLVLLERVAPPEPEGAS